MHNAPPVVYPVGFFVGQSMPALVLALLCGHVLVFWQMQTVADPLSVTLSGLVWLLAAVLTVWWRRREWMGTGSLGWTGQEWLWADHQGTRQPLSVQCLLDAGSSMLVRVHVSQAGHRFLGSGFTSWAWVRESSMPSQWHGFRCAVYSRPVIVA